MSENSGGIQSELSRRDLTNMVEYDESTHRLKLVHSSGYFSNCSVTLWALTGIYPTTDRVVVDWPGQSGWRDPRRSDTNLFAEYFEPDYASNFVKLSRVGMIDHHGVYEDIDYDQINPYIQTYFKPSVCVRQRINQFVEKYGIDYRNTVGILFRGTDKWIETGTVAPGWLFTRARDLLRKNANLRLLIQTDVAFIRDTYAKEFGQRAFFIEEMPVTDSGVSIQQLPVNVKGIGNFELGMNLLATVNILSKCAYIIANTGNVSLWIYLYRGHAMNACQFLPGPPEMISSLEARPTLRRRVLKYLRKKLRKMMMT